MTVFDRHDDLPYDTHCHLLSLEVWIGNMEGRTMAIPTNGNTFIDDGTVDAEDAVKTVNAVIAAIRFLTDQRDRLRKQCEGLAQAALNNGNSLLQFERALIHIKDLADSEAAEPLDEAIAIATKALGDG